MSIFLLLFCGLKQPRNSRSDDHLKKRKGKKQEELDLLGEEAAFLIIAPINNGNGLVR
jgi:hypothetical protein